MSDKMADFDIIKIAHKLGIRYIKSGPGYEEIFRCPFCGDSIKHKNKGHLYINTSNNTFKCHRCGIEGNALTLWSQYHGVDNKEAYKQLIKDKDSAPAPALKTGPEIKESPLADIEKRNKVYRKFLSILKLAKRHKEDLLSRGLHEKQIYDGIYKSIPGANNPKKRRQITNYLSRYYDLEGIPGFFIREGKYGDYWDFVAPRGYLIPVKDAKGRIQALQMRLDEGDEKYKWFSSNGRPGGATSGAPAHYSGGKGRVWITEGPLKADVASVLMNTPFIGVPGVNSYKEARKILEELEAGDPVIAFDSDAKHNPNVQKALENFISHLKENGFRPQNCSWPEALGKGVDDVLLNLKKQDSITFLVDGVPVTIKRKVNIQVSVG